MLSAAKGNNTNKETKELDSIGDELRKLNVDYNKVELLDKPLTSSQIVKKIGGSDKTKGSCSSLAFAYAGNREGYDVYDFRGGASRDYFAKGDNIKKIVTKVGGTISDIKDDYLRADSLLKQVVEGKEYYFTCAKHAAIVRKTGGKYQYLELQGTGVKNGWKELNSTVLKDRFGAKIGGDDKDFIVDIKLLTNDKYFKRVLCYLNTEKKKQIKGIGGSIK